MLLSGSWCNSHFSFVCTLASRGATDCVECLYSMPFVFQIIHHNRNWGGCVNDPIAALQHRLKLVITFYCSSLEHEDWFGTRQMNKSHSAGFQGSVDWVWISLEGVYPGETVAEDLGQASEERNQQCEQIKPQQHSVMVKVEATKTGSG